MKTSLTTMLTTLMLLWTMLPALGQDKKPAPAKDTKAATSAVQNPGKGKHHFWLSDKTGLSASGNQLLLTADAGKTWNSSHRFGKEIVGIGMVEGGPWIVALLTSKAAECEDAAIELHLSKDSGETWKVVPDISISDYDGSVTVDRCDKPSGGQVCFHWERGICCSSCECGCEPEAVRFERDGSVHTVGE